jgi:hypothetical protein
MASLRIDGIGRKSPDRGNGVLFRGFLKHLIREDKPRILALGIKIIFCSMNNQIA